MFLHSDTSLYKMALEASVTFCCYAKSNKGVSLTIRKWKNIHNVSPYCLCKKIDSETRNKETQASTEY